MLLGLVGKPSAGKSTFFSAATLIDVEIAARPFVTIKPNQGTGFVSTDCVHKEMNVVCEPQNSKCVQGKRMIPATLLDVGGLIEGSWRGKGIGNQFLNELMRASALIHVLDVSGTTDAEGKPCSLHDPAIDVGFLESEIDYWVKGILSKNWEKIAKQASATKQVVEIIAKQLSGLGISEEQVKDVLEKHGFGEKPGYWEEEEVLRFASEIRKKSKPMLIAANKIDVKGAKENIERLRKEFPEHLFVPCSAESELALRKASKAGIIEYFPSSSDFTVLQQPNEKQKKALDFIKENVLNAFGSTGIQEAINKTAFGLLQMITVYPVEDSNKLCSGKGHVLPDAFLVKQGATAIDLAGTIHSSFPERFVAAIDCKTRKKLGKETELKNNDVIKIQLRN